MHEFTTIDLEHLGHVTGGDSDAAMMNKVGGWLDVADKGTGTLSRLSNVISKFVLMAQPGFHGFTPEQAALGTGQAPTQSAEGGRPPGRRGADTSVSVRTA